MATTQPKLKIQNLLRTDSHDNSIAAASSLILGVAEPYYIHNYFNGSEYEDIICVGDGSSTLANLLTNKKYFVAGYGAGYDLPKATESSLGGIRINPNKGIKIDGSGRISINLNDFIGSGLQEQGEKLNLLLNNYSAETEINLYTDLNVHGSLTANELITIPTSVGNIVELRKDSTTPLSTGEVAGLYIHNIPNTNDNVEIGINKDAELVFNNKINNYHIPIIPSNSLTNIPIIGINSNGIIEAAELKTIKINQRRNSATAWTEKELDLINGTDLTVNLTIPQSLSDLQDYDSSLTGPSYVSTEDRNRWNGVITDVATSSSYTDPVLVPLGGTNGQRLILPTTTLPISSSKTLELNESGNLDLKKVTVAKPAVVPQITPTTITYISNIEVDEYGRVTKIERSQLYIG